MLLRLVLTTVAAATALAAAATPVASAGSATSPRAMRAVVHAWSDRLNAGDNAGVARLFAVPAVAIQGPFVYRLATRAQVVRWHAGLPCSGEVTSISVRGRYATAVFRLGDRRTSKCDEPGTVVAARFEIVGGKIVTWVQVPVPRHGGEPPLT